jgi:aminopeptidase N
MVHDFMWGADPEYIHDVLPMENGPDLHFFYKNNPDILENWKNLQPKTAAAMEFFSKNLGTYPYQQYSVVQGGDGGMEYAMSTLITGERSFESLVGVMVHEMAHSWFQHVLATNEARHEWMDEGFTSFISALCMNQIMDQNKDNPFSNSYRGYFSLATSGREQPMATHADRYSFNSGYGISAYSKGAVFLAQLGYVIGQDNLMKTLRRYFDDFKFKHPTPNDFIRTAEKVSGMELEWYLVDWTQTTNTIDYGVKSVEPQEGGTQILLERKGLMPMPIDLLVVFQDGSQKVYHMPLRMMRGEKANPYPGMDWDVLEDWPWAQPEYAVQIDAPKEEIMAVLIDPSQLMADVDPQNNAWQQE